MADINIAQARELTQLSKSEAYPYKDSYGKFNQAILAAAKEGKQFMSFDFIDASKPQPETDGSKKNTNRIYLGKDGEASYDVYDYPKYLEARGFKVEMRERQNPRGYKEAKSYYITW